MRIRHPALQPQRKRRPTEPPLRALRVAVAHHQQQLAILEQDDPLNYGLADLFQAATPLERERLAELLGTRRSSPRALVAALSRFGGRRVDTPVGQTPESSRRRRGYDAMVRRVAGTPGTVAVEMVEAEAQIIATAFGRMVDNLTPATMSQLAATQRALLQTLAPDAAQRMTAALFASIARAAGFDLHLMANSVTASIAPALGLTPADPQDEAPATRISHGGLARLGWLVLAQWGLTESSPREGALEAPVVLLVATLRQRLVRERGARIRQHQLSLQRDLKALSQL